MQRPRDINAKAQDNSQGISPELRNNLGAVGETTSKDLVNFLPIS